MAKNLFKKGLNPLVSTIMLIGLAVSIGASIMSFGSSYYEEKGLSGEEGKLCKKVELEVLKVDNKQKICYEKQSKIIEFIVTNKGSVDIESLIVWVVGKEVYVKDLIGSIKPGYPSKQRVDYDFSAYGDIKQVHLTPKIKKENEEEQITCSDKKLVLEGITPC